MIIVNDFDFEFNQVDNIYDDREPPPKGRKGPFYAQDFSRMQSNTAKRARHLAKPIWSSETGRDDTQFSELLKEEEFLNATADFSFKHHYTGTGDWSDYKQFEVAVSSTMRSANIPEKEMMYVIPITDIKKK